MDSITYSRPYIKLVVIEDIPLINKLVTSLWGTSIIYSKSEYYDILNQNLSYAYMYNNDMIGLCLVHYSEYYRGIIIAILCIKREYQSRGFGKSLLKYCINNCVKNNYDTFYLHVTRTNFIALNLYKKLGFKEINSFRNYYNSNQEPKVLMKLEKKQDIPLDIISNLRNSLQNNRSYANNFSEYGFSGNDEKEQDIPFAAVSKLRNSLQNTRSYEDNFIDYGFSSNDVKKQDISFAEVSKLRNSLQNTRSYANNFIDYSFTGNTINENQFPNLDYTNQSNIYYYNNNTVLTNNNYNFF